MNLDNIFKCSMNNAEEFAEESLNDALQDKRIVMRGGWSILMMLLQDKTHDPL